MRQSTRGTIAGGSTSGVDAWPCSSDIIAAADWPAARRDLAEAHRIATRGGMRLHLADHHLESARLHLATGDHDAARAAYTTAHAEVAAMGYHRRDPELAALAAALADPAPAAPPR